MKIIGLLLSFTLLLFINVNAQALTDSKEWAELIKSLEKENWQNANKLSLACLKKIPDAEQEDFTASMLRYMYIYSEAGLMNMDKVSQEDALKKVKDFAGHNIVLPAHPVALKNAFNSIQMHNNKTDTLFTTASNLQATSIFSFEYVAMEKKWPIDDYNKQAGKMYRLSGVLKSITVEGHMLPRFRLLVDKGKYEALD